MKNSRRSSSISASRFTIQGLRFHFQQSVERFRYRHILVCNSPHVEDRAALLLGFELASLHQSPLTLLQALPRPQERNAYGLDAIGLLHAAADDLRPTCAAGAGGESQQLRMHELVADTVAPGLLDEVNWRVECREGRLVECVLSSVDESAADLVILSAKPFWRWLLIVPFVVRTIERRTRANVIVIRGRNNPA